MNNCVEHSNLLQASVTLAQILLENLTNYGYQDRFEIGENIIEFLYKYLSSKDSNDKDLAFYEYYQHNEDCRYECYCCAGCEDIEIDTTKPTILDENIQNIIKILRREKTDSDEIVEDIFASDEDDEKQDW